ncbi:MAG TPA: hypothetical protein VF817_02610 [Patescibacteria group bacterium]
MPRFTFKDDGDNLSGLMDATQNVGKPATSNDPATTINADNGEVIQLNEPPAHTKD